MKRRKVEARGEEGERGKEMYQKQKDEKRRKKKKKKIFTKMKKNAKKKNSQTTMQRHGLTMSLFLFFIWLVTLK